MCLSYDTQTVRENLRNHYINNLDLSVAQEIKNNTSLLNTIDIDIKLGYSYTPKPINTNLILFKALYHDYNNHQFQHAPNNGWDNLATSTKLITIETNHKNIIKDSRSLSMISNALEVNYTNEASKS